MLILGLLLVVLSAAVAALLIVYNGGGEAQTVTVFGRDLADATLLQAFVAGLVVAAVFMIGLALVRSASRRARENRVRYRAARKEAKAASAERDELAKQLDAHEQVGTPADTTPTPAAGTPVPPQQTGPRHAAPGGQQPVITNIGPGDTPTARR
jgi:hypothetical protein